MGVAKYIKGERDAIEEVHLATAVNRPYRFALSSQKASYGTADPAARTDHDMGCLFTIHGSSFWNRIWIAKILVI